MPKGYIGKILRVDLSKNTIDVEKPSEYFYRTYMGGKNIGAYYLLKELQSHIDPLSPENLIIFSTSIITGVSVPGLAQFSVVSKSPLTNGYGESEAGGHWGPELKFAGFDAIVVQGKAENPVYLWVHNGKAEIKSAEHLWGKDTLQTQKAIRDELNDPKIQIAQIGIAGENKVRFACIMSELKHANGRSGLGAVMGSKNLKAIAVRGRKSSVSFFDKELLQQIAREFSKEYKNYAGLSQLQEFGTSATTEYLQNVGMLPTGNFREGVFEKADDISGARMKETIVIGNEGCYACPVKCKRLVRVKKYDVNPAFGGPEYETIGTLGAYCYIGDIEAIAKGGELCNKYGLDTISTGGMIAFTMECFEEGLITKKETGGLECKFGKSDVMLELVEMIAHRKGIGEILADGPLRSIQEFGEEAKKYAMHVKNEPLPAHDPRGKVGVGLGYAVAPHGPDHGHAQHDTCFSEEYSHFLKQLNPLGVLTPVKAEDIGPSKVRLFIHLQQIYSLYDTLGVCKFAAAPGGALDFKKVVNIVEAATGWDTSLWELMKVGERGINLAKVFNTREGFTSKDDMLPDRLFTPIPEGPLKGAKISRGGFKKAIRSFYTIRGWNPQTGIPEQSKLEELNIGWTKV